MDNVDLQVLRQLNAWRAGGHRAVMGTITRTWGSAPRPIGSVVAVRDDGLVAGSVSGGCIEDDLIDRVRRSAVATERPQVVRYGVSGDEAARFGLPCGGTLELVLETVGRASALDELLTRLDAGERVQRVLQLASGEAMLRPAPRDADRLQLDAERLVTTHGPAWRLLVIGAGQMTRYLAEMAQALDYQVTVCDPREEHGDPSALTAVGVRFVRTMPDDTVQAMQVDAHTAVIALTHDPKLDDLALMEALRSPAFYVGAIGSFANQAKRRERLIEHFGLTEGELDRLHGPVGIKNGARTPPEIVVSILAELTAVRYGYRIPRPVALAPEAAVPAGCAAP